jgi:hypothetical protein
MKLNYQCRYVYSVPFNSPYHGWELIGRWGGVNLRIVDHGEDHEKKYGERYSGGLEYHWRQPPRHMDNQPPSHSPCWLLHCPCWHDGTSLYVSESLIPYWSEGATSHDDMFRRLARLADDNLSPERAE